MDVKTDIAHAQEYFAAENFSRAKRLCERILAADDKNAEAWALLGTIEMRRARYVYAIPSLEKGVELEPKNAELLGKLAFAYQQERQIQRALETYLKALEIEPDNYETLYCAGVCQTSMGDFKTGQANLEKAIGISNQMMEPYRLLADFTPKGEDPKFLKELEALEDAVKAKPALEQVHWHYALASANKKQGNLEKFEQHLNAASSLQSRNANKWLVAHTAMLSAAEQKITPAMLEAATPEKEKTVTPIFIVGMPRSGSTLVEQILATNENVFGADELLYLRRFFIEDMSRHMGVPYPLFLENLTAEDMAGLARRYQDAVRHLAGGQEFITDKMVGNVFFAGFIKKVMPWAKVIYIKRHPYDMALSIYSRYFNASTSFMNHLDELAEYTKCHDRAMKLWRIVCPGFIHELRYEDLVSDLEGESRKMFEFCGLDWNPAALEFHKSDRQVFTHSLSQVRQEIYTSSIGKWKDHAGLLKPFIDGVEDLMEDYGYANELKAG